MTTAGQRHEYLTPREVEVLAFLAEGLSVQQIADRMFITKRAVEEHITNLLTKAMARTVHIALAFYCDITVKPEYRQASRLKKEVVRAMPKEKRMSWKAILKGGKTKFPSKQWHSQDSQAKTHPGEHL